MKDKSINNTMFGPQRTTVYQKQKYGSEDTS